MSQDGKPDEASSPRPPDAFFPGVPRHRLVLLGALLVVVGLAVAVFVPPLTFMPGEGSQRLSLFFLLAGTATVILGVVFLFKKPSRGSTPGSKTYEQLVAKQQAATYRSFMRNIVTGLVVTIGMALFFLPAGLLRLEADPGQSQVFIIVGVISVLGVIGFGFAVAAARNGRFKNVKPPPS